MPSRVILNFRHPSPTFFHVRISSFPRGGVAARSQAPDGLVAGPLRAAFHYVDVAAGMKLAAEGKVAHVVPFKHHGVKMTLYKGEAALEARRTAASTLDASIVSKLQKPRKASDKEDWAWMQKLHDAGISRNPVTGMAVINPEVCKPALLTAIWRADGNVADTVNTKQMGQTDEALDELQMRLHEHAAQLRKTAPKWLSRSAGAQTKRSRASPSRSSSDEGTDAGEPARERKLRPRRVISESDDEDELILMEPVAGSDDATDAAAEADAALHVPDLDDFIGSSPRLAPRPPTNARADRRAPRVLHVGSCSGCGGPTPYCTECGVAYCAWCELDGCEGAQSARVAAPLTPKCKPDTRRPPSPPPSPPDQSLQCALLRGSSQ